MSSNTFALKMVDLYRKGKGITVWLIGDSNDTTPIKGIITECGTDYCIVGNTIIRFKAISCVRE